MGFTASRRQFLANASLAVTSLAIGSARAEAQEIDRFTTGPCPQSAIRCSFRAHWSTYVGAIMSLVQEGLLGFADDLSLTTSVASSWEQTGPTVFAYTLREGVTFGDGSPLTARRMSLRTFTYHMDPASR